ncbi:hypothetical protein E2C01_048058 [Portunus trituberculatus]|uniref:Uncharacterized protein n=1 Tax=Portunus trituberculatus TaxID=210409 RepID=A0A5B7G254_PORTR|nr:hypothetical protein [Portunus trituberculatus]
MSLQSSGKERGQRSEGKRKTERREMRRNRRSQPSPAAATVLIQTSTRRFMSKMPAVGLSIFPGTTLGPELVGVRWS